MDFYSPLDGLLISSKKYFYLLLTLILFENYTQAIYQGDYKPNSMGMSLVSTGTLVSIRIQAAVMRK